MNSDTAPTPTAKKIRFMSVRRLLLIGLGFGAGFAITLFLIIGAAALYKLRPRSWEARAITAQFASLSLNQHFSEQRHQTGFAAAFEYDVQNNTRSDYRLDSRSAVILAKLPSGALSKQFGSYQVMEPTLDSPPMIPAGAKVRITVRVHYAPPGFAEVNWNDLKTLERVVNRRLREIDGLVIFDQSSHYRIDLPNGWPQVAKDSTD